MNTRAITLIATIAVIGIVAVGAGYAYTALTVNDGNNAEAKYMTLTQDAYTFKASFNENFDSITASGISPSYRINADTTGYNTAVTGYVLIDIGTTTITTTPHGYDTNADTPAIALTIDSTSGFVYNATLNYYLVQGTSIVGVLGSDGTTWKAANGTDPFSITVTEVGNESAVAAYNDITLKLCYGYTTTAATHTDAVNDGYVTVAPADLANGKIVFKVNVTNATNA